MVCGRSASNVAIYVELLIEETKKEALDKIAFLGLVIMIWYIPTEIIEITFKVT